ncbi:MoaD family protein [Halobaculum litoreum]|uniref:MoaD family protein n=1 Tax=Halobaculum litoreum TaxID=3031998 RepID=UPI0024C21BF9|nr:MoaD family protein [Halobaculum sp. DT92]
MTIEVECRLFGPFREDAGVDAVVRETTATTVGGLLRELERDYPALAGRLVDEAAGTTAGSTVVTKAKKNVRHLDGLDTPLTDGDVIRLVPSVYGG